MDHGVAHLQSSRETRADCEIAQASGPPDEGNNPIIYHPEAGTDQPRSNNSRGVEQHDSAGEGPARAAVDPSAMEVSACRDASSTASMPTKVQQNRRRPRSVPRADNISPSNVPSELYRSFTPNNQRHVFRQRRAEIASARMLVTLEDNLARWSSGWRPPPLRELPRGGKGFFSGWTHMGPLDRFELVKSANRCHEHLKCLVRSWSSTFRFLVAVGYLLTGVRYEADEV